MQQSSKKVRNSLRAFGSFMRKSVDVMYDLGIKTLDAADSMNEFQRAAMRVKSRKWTDGLFYMDNDK